MNKNLSVNSIVKKIAQNTSFFKTEGDAYYMRYEPEFEKGVMQINSKTLEQVVASISTGVLSRSQKESLLQMVMQIAKKEAVSQPVYIRVGFHKNAVYLNLGRPGVVKITAKEIKITAKSCVAFCKPKTMRDLPLPDLSEDLDPWDSLKKLLPIINVRKQDFKLVIAWLLSVFCRTGTKPILILEGLEGSAKTTTEKMLTRIIDWHDPAYISLPTNAKDLFIVAQNRDVIAFDNVSDIKPYLSDLICQISTGGAIAMRELYTNDNEFVIYAQAAILLSGITTGVNRGDLLDRAIKIEAPQIIPNNRKLESELEDIFRKNHPAILGAIVRLVQYALQNEDKLPHELRDTRLVDFAEWTWRWASAVKISQVKLINAIIANQKDSKVAILNEDSVAAVLMEILSDDDVWQGSAMMLYHEFIETAANLKLKYSERVQSQRALSIWLERSKKTLAAAGIDWSKQRTNKGIVYTIKRVTAK